MRKRACAFLLSLVLLGLVGCTGETRVASSTTPYDGAWYFAKNAVECRFGDGKIYRDDNSTSAGQSLAGIYSDAGDHIDANLADTGSVDTVRALYLVTADRGEVLCDSADGKGEVYFFRDPVAAMAALAEGDAGSETARPSATPEEDVPVDRTMPGEPADASDAPSPLPEVITLTPDSEPAPTAETRSNSGTVWIPQSGSKYHSSPSCSGMKNPKKVTLSEAQSKGYTPCKRCH